MIRKIVGVKDPVLRQKAKSVKRVDKKIEKIIKDLKDTLKVQKDPEGVGLAAPQIGKSYRIFAVDYEDFKRIVINPKIISIKKTKMKKSKNNVLEGCLSIPHYYGPLRRSDGITIEYLNEKGEKITESFKGFRAQIIQHEIDHLNGILFTDHIINQKAPLYKIRGDDYEEVELE